MNSCNFVGRLTKDPEASVTANQKVYCNFSIAVDRGYKGNDGNRVIDFIPCIAWDPTATLITKYFHKGDLIGVTGRLEISSWEDRGEKRTRASVLVNNIDFIQGKKEPKTESAPEPTPPTTPLEEAAKDYELPYETQEDEELPFEV